VFKYHSDPTLYAVDFILTIIHANTPHRARQKSKDVTNARTHNTVGERVVSLVLCTSSTSTWTMSSSQSVLSKPQRKTSYDRIVATSSSHGDTPRGIIIAQQHPSRGTIYRTASSSRGILHRAGFFIARDSHRVVFSLRSILIARYSHHATFSSSALSIARHSYRAVFFIARHRHRTVTCEKCVAHKCNAGALCKSSNACRTECQPKKVIYSELCCFLLDSRIHSLHIRPPACRYRHLC
jgi:hypothetical protein